MHTSPLKKSLSFSSAIIWVFIGLVFSCSSVGGQDRHIIDSLEAQLKSYDAYKTETTAGSNLLRDSNKVITMYNLLLQYWSYENDTAKYYCQKILDISQHIGYQKGIGYGYNGIGLINMQRKNYPLAIEYFNKALDIRNSIGDKVGAAWTYNDLGLMYGNMGELEKAIQYHTNALLKWKELGDKEGMAASYGKIGHCYYSLGKFPEAVSNYLMALKLGEEDSDKQQICRFCADIGDVYYAEGNYPEALTNYQKALKFERQIGSNYMIAFGYGRVGRALYKQGNDSAAIKYLQNALAVYYNLRNGEEIANIHSMLGQVYLSMGNYALALINADSALRENDKVGSLMYRADDYIEIGSIYEKEGKLKAALDSANKGLLLAEKTKARVEMQDAYMLLANINMGMDNYKEASENYRQYISAHDSIINDQSVKKIETLEMNYAFSEKEDSIHDEVERNNIIKAAEIKRKGIITDSAIIISILILLAAVLLLRNVQLKRKKEKLVFENQKHRMERELANAQTVLDEYTQSMAEKNKLLEEFKANVEEFKTQHDKERIENIEYLNKATILTEEDWNKFKQLFEQVHKDFFKRLKEKLPDLTQAETRLVCLTKLNIGTKQMAAILGVSYDTIKKSRHRLRKKLGLTEEDSIDDIVSGI